MRKCKILVFSAIAAAAVVAIVLRGKQSGEAASHRASSRATVVVEVEQPQPIPQFVAAQPPASTNQTPTVRGTLPFVLTSAKPFTKPLRLAAEALGAKTVSVVSRNALLVEVDEAARARLSADSRFEEVSEFLPSSKVQPELAAALSGGAKAVDVSIVSLAAEYRPIVMACLKSGGGEMLKGCINEGDVIRANLPADLVSALAMRGDVRWMEKFERPQLMNDVAVEPVAMNVREVWDTHGLTGAGQFISTSDSGIDTGDLATMHEDLRDRVLEMKVVEGASKTDVSGHGTHTAGSIVGNGTKSGGQIRGTAHGANLYAWFCGAPDKQHIYMPQTLRALYTADGTWDAHIHSASWGSAVNGEYNAECSEHDNYVWKNPEFLPVFSAGNEGDGAYTVGAPAASKNVLTVGATQNLRTDPPQPPPPYDPLGNGDPTVTAEYSSRGPCQDGRIKPDIAAPGTGVLSTRAFGVDYSYGIYDDYYAYDTGTSMACPLTAGAVALVRQWLVEDMGFEDVDGKRPTAALMKAVITGGAKDAAVPNNDQGWGRVDLAETLFPSGGRAVKLIDRIPFEQDFVTNIIVKTTNSAPLDVQLVWVDYPGNAGTGQTAPKLVNDLDLTIETHVAGLPQILYGNGGTEPDTLNNVESVRIDDAEASTYIITVNCKAILHDYTEGGAAALYIRGAFDPGVEAEEPPYVHLRKQGKNFMSLSRALAAVRDDGETVEICDWVFLDKSVTVTNDCTIAATNADASASYVLRRAGASLTVANATAMLSNVVFTASTETLVTVEDGGCLKLGPKVDLGVDYEHVSVRTAAANGFELAGDLKQKILFQCAASKYQNEKFGTYSCPDEVAESNAVKIVCVDDIERETRGGIGAGKTLVWKQVLVPLEEASGYFVDDKGVTNTYLRMERALKKFKERYEAGQASEFVARKDGAFDIAFEVDAPMAFRSEGTERFALKAGSASGFEIFDGGSLTVTNLMFCAYEGNPTNEIGFISIDGGALTLDSGAVLSNMTGYVSYGSGVVDLLSGSMTMNSGSAILNCTAGGGLDGHGQGGGIYVLGSGCALHLRGGRIANCQALECGGGIYAAGWKDDAGIDVSGDVVVAGNVSDSNPKADDIYMYDVDARPGFRLVGEVIGKVGVYYSDASMWGRSEDGFAFMVNAVGSVSDATLRSFVNNRDEDMGAEADATAGMLVWKKRVYDGQCAPADAVALQIDRDGHTNYYPSVANAFAYMGDNSPYVVELQANESLQKETCVAVRPGRVVTLTSRTGEVFWIDRKGTACIYVPADTSLTLRDILLRRSQPSADVGLVTNALVAVDGGSLTLAEGSCISNVLGNTTRDANAVTVCNRGTFTMLPGSLITKCANYYNEDKETPTTYAKDYGVGGGVLVDGESTAYLRGGTISGCLATRGGGLYACNESKVYVSGGMRIAGNHWLVYGGAVGGDSNLLVEDGAEAIVDGEVTDDIGSGDFISWLRDTNLVAQVSADWQWSVDALTNSAARFSHDILAGVVGVAVTNQSQALIVWSNAVDEQNRSYVYGGVTYGLAGELPPVVVVQPPMVLFTVTTNTPGPVMFTSVTYAGPKCNIKLENLVAGAAYSLFKTNSLAGGFRIEGVKPFTNFTAEANGPIELEVWTTGTPLFWRVTGEETYTTNYFGK